MYKQPSSLQFSIPAWLSDYARGHASIKDIQQRMDFVIEASRRNIHEKTGGPFAAAIFEAQSGKLISLGVNLVTSEGLSILHAEMVAIAIAQKKLASYDLGRSDLSEHELVTSTEPCAMCMGAIPWSGVRRVVIGARDADARSIGFDEGDKPKNWRDLLTARHIHCVQDVKRNEAKAVLKQYRQLGGHIYNTQHPG